MSEENSENTKNTYNCFYRKDVEFLSCFYDTPEMRARYPQNYPTKWSMSVISNPNRIVCTPEIGLFATTIVTLDKKLSWNEKKSEIREQMKLSNVIIASPEGREPQVINL